MLLCQQLTYNGNHVGNQTYNFQCHWLIPTTPALMAVLVSYE